MWVNHETQESTLFTVLKAIDRLPFSINGEGKKSHRAVRVLTEGLYYRSLH